MTSGCLVVVWEGAVKRVLSRRKLYWNQIYENGFVEYDPVNNPEQALFSFQIRRGPTD
jgi:hypothetical protein